MAVVPDASASVPLDRVKGWAGRKQASEGPLVLGLLESLVNDPLDEDALGKEEDQDHRQQHHQ